MAQRDHHTLALLRARLDPSYVIDPKLLDHHEHEWTVANLPGRHPRRD